MSLGYHSEDLKFKLIHNIHIQKKRGASLSLASRSKALELPD